MFGIKVWFGMFFAILLLTVSTLPIRADSREETRREIQDAYNRMNTAIENKNLEAYIRFLQV